MSCHAGRTYHFYVRHNDGLCIPGGRNQGIIINERGGVDSYGMVLEKGTRQEKCKSASKYVAKAVLPGGPYSESKRIKASSFWTSQASGATRVAATPYSNEHERTT